MSLLLQLNLGFGWSASAGIAPTVTTTTLADGAQGSAYSVTLAATGDVPITWSVSAGSLPAGLSLSSGGVLSGIPSGYGSFAFTVQATNAYGSDTQALSLDIAAATLQGGAGWPIYYPPRRKKRLIDQPNRHLAKILDDVVNELYGELTEDEVPAAVQAEAAKLVKPFVSGKARKLAVPPESAVDWVALERDAERVQSLVALWRRHEIDMEIEIEDEFMLMVD